MKKVFGQTVRDLKREVNKKVLKVPGIEQKVLDATSNESWGPHGTLLADIAAASRNYHEYQKIMAVIWKRINDTGKNWRHVYKALVVLEYLVANGSERVIDEIREHAHQISTLADFQYIDSNGRDQGSNVRRKSQGLVMLLNDKEQVAEVRKKAAANREKFHNANPGSGMHRPGGYGNKYDDDRYSREGGYRDDDRNSRNGDSYSYDGDRHSRDSEERYGRDSYRENDYRDNRNGPRSRSSDRDGDRSLDDDGQYSAQGLDRKFSDQSISGPPSYEEAVVESRSPEQNERDQDIPSVSVPKPSSPHLTNDGSPTVNAPDHSPSPAKLESEGFDEFDPRLSAPVASTTTDKNVEMDLLGFSDSYPSNPLSTIATQAATPKVDVFAANPGFGASDVVQQPFDDPFGEAPFRAVPSHDNSAPAQPSVVTAAPTFLPNEKQNSELHQQAQPVPVFGFGDSFTALTYGQPGASSQFPSHGISNPEEEEIDILAGILPPSGPSPVTTVAQTPYSAPNGHQQHPDFGTTAYGDSTATSQVSPHAIVQYNQENFHHISGNLASPFSSSSGQADAGVYGYFGSEAGTNSSESLQMSHQTQIGTDFASPFAAQSAQHAQYTANSHGDFGSQAGSTASITSQVSSPSQAGTSLDFNQGSSQHQVGPSASPFSAQSQNGLAMFNNGESGLNPVTSQMSPQAPTGMSMPINHGNFQHQAGPLASPFSPQSQNGQVMPLANGDFGSQGGQAAPVTSQMSPQATSGMNMPVPFNHGNFQHQGGPSESPFSSQSQNGQAMVPNSGDFGSQAGPTTAVNAQTSPQAQAGMNMPYNHGNFQNKTEPTFSSPYSASLTQNGQDLQPNNGAPFPQYASTTFSTGISAPPGVSSAGSFSHNMTTQTPNGSIAQFNGNSFLQQQQVSGPPAVQYAQSANRDMLNNMLSQSGQQQSHLNSQPPVSSSVGPLAIVPQQQEKKFQTKSTVWADTLSRGLVDLNISGPKTNPLADIGVDFDSINRKEKRMEKQPAAPVTSTITMGKAMGSGSGMGRAGAGSLRPAPNPMAGNMGMGGMGMVGGQGQGMRMGMGMGMGMGGMGMGGTHGSGMNMGGMGMGGGHGPGMGMGGSGMGGGSGSGMGMGMGMGMGGGYGGFNQQQPMGMGMGMGMGQGGYNNMGVGMNMGMGQGGANGYNNPMMGGSGYPQQPYGGGYR